MWVAKFRVLNKGNLFVELVKKYNLTVIYYPISYYEKRNRYYFIATGIIKGKEENKRKFLVEIKKSKNIEKTRKLELCEYEGDFFTIISSHTKNNEIDKFVRVFYDPSLIHIKPAIILKNGWEEFEVASLNRKDIEKMLEIGKRIYSLELLNIKQKKIKNFGFMSILPELTEKQKEALELALQHGYYNYPRKISLDKLSKKTKTSFSTLQAHIRKAENKIISFVINSFKG